ncbi:LPXTG cell wall anchor domain-containing protein [Fructilactobacillus frigidiflavus]|uniref:LPXTG cell wall anchor domain-containing protein n=1 Tax=Fructilactobacillus frigidiflavus TaxID=3242688 RepID=UPI003757EE89
MKSASVSNSASETQSESLSTSTSVTLTSVSASQSGKEPETELPQTGQDNSNGLMTSIGSAILAMMVILGLGKRKKKEDK